MVSEDPQDLGGFPVIHRLGDLGDVHDPRHTQVPADLHELDDPGELLEVVSLRRSQGVLEEERDDHIPQVTEPPHAVPEHVLPVVVVPRVRIDLPASEKTDEVFQDIAAGCALGDGEFGSNLPSKSHLAASIDGTAEAAFPIHEPHDPSYGRESFLLVFRTPHIVTAMHYPTVWVEGDTASSGRYSGFPAYGRLRTASSPMRGAAPPCLPGGFLP
jgi:hypothetical protein